MTGDTYNVSLTLAHPIKCTPDDWSAIGDYLIETYGEIAQAIPMETMFRQIQNYIDTTPPAKRNIRYYITTTCNQKTIFHYTTTPNKTDHVYYYIEILPTSIYLRKGSIRPYYNPLLREELYKC